MTAEFHIDFSRSASSEDFNSEVKLVDVSSSLIAALSVTSGTSGFEFPNCLRSPACTKSSFRFPAVFFSLRALRFRLFSKSFEYVARRFAITTRMP